MKSSPAAETADGRRLWLAWLPLPVLALAIAGLWVADPRAVHESHGLMVLLNVVFTWLASLCVCVLTARGFLAGGQPGLLLFGCGALLWGVTSLAAATIVDRVNATITVHNVGALLAAACHGLGLLWSRPLARPRRWLLAGYAAALLLALLLFCAAFAGWTPQFFVQGQGGTPLRQVVLLMASGLFAAVAAVMLRSPRWRSTPFYHWYGLGLALIAIGLVGVFLLKVQGGALGWTNRLTQYLGSLYLCIAALTAARTAGTRTPASAARDAAWWQPPAFQHQSARSLLPRYGAAGLAIALAYALHRVVAPQFGPGFPPYLLFELTGLPVLLFAGVGPALLAVLLTDLVVAYALLPPVGVFAIAAPADRLGLLLYTGLCAFCIALFALYRHHHGRALALERAALLRESGELLTRQVELIDPVRAEVIAREMQRFLRRRDSAAEPTEPATDTARWPEQLATACGVALIALGALVLLGWAGGWEALKRVAAGLPSMKANTALCFVLVGAALALRHHRGWSGAGAGLVACVAGLTLVEYVAGVDLGLDQWLFHDVRDEHTLFPGRMAQVTAVNFLLGGAALLLLAWPARAARWMQQTLALGVTLLGLVASLGYFYHVEPLYRLDGHSSIALHTTVAFVVLGLGLLAARPDGFVRVLAVAGPGAQLACWLLPVAALLPILLGWLHETGEQSGWFASPLGAGLLVVQMIFCLSAIIWWLAAALNRADAVRRDAESQLRNQAALMDQSGEALLVREHDGSLRYWNRGAEKLYGWSAAEALGHSAHDFLRTEGASLAEKNAQLERTGRWEGELARTTRDGRRLVLESRQTATRASDGRLLILESDRDITARKRAEEELRASEERFRLLGEATFEGILKTVEGRIVDANEQLLGILGYRRQDILGRAVTDFLQPADRASVMQPVYAHAQTHRELTLKRNDGAEVIIEYQGRDALENGRTVRYTAVRDVSEQKRAAAALQQSEQRLRNILEVAPIGMTLLAATGHILDTNRAALDLYNLRDKSEAVGQSAFDFVTPEEQPQVRAVLQQAFATGSVPGAEFTCLRRDASRFTVRVAGTRLHDAQDAPYAVLVMMQDVTEARAAAAEKQRQLAALRAANGELQRFNRAFVNRELRMVELKREINALCAATSAPPRYAGAAAEAPA